MAYPAANSAASSSSRCAGSSISSHVTSQHPVRYFPRISVRPVTNDSAGNRAAKARPPTIVGHALRSAACEAAQPESATFASSPTPKMPYVPPYPFVLLAVKSATCLRAASAA